MSSSSKRLRAPEAWICSCVIVVTAAGAIRAELWVSVALEVISMSMSCSMDISKNGDSSAAGATNGASRVRHRAKGSDRDIGRALWRRSAGGFLLRNGSGCAMHARLGLSIV